ncbi:MAG: bleomycin resistance protein [Myxococcota bacterium]
MVERTTRLEACAPILVVSDVPASVDYYRDALGFDVAFVWGEPSYYAGVCRDDVTLHLQAADRTERPAGGGAVSLFVGDADAIHRELVERGARVLMEPRTYPYGMRDFNAADLDGNQLTFGHAVEGSQA